MKEYPASSRGGFGDVDSGPVIMNYGVSPTGFMIAGTRILVIAITLNNFIGLLFCSALLWTRAMIGSTSRAAPGPLGNAIMFAMLTTVPTEIFNGTGTAN